MRLSVIHRMACCVTGGQVFQTGEGRIIQLAVQMAGGLPVDDSQGGGIECLLRLHPKCQNRAKQEEHDIPQER